MTCRGQVSGGGVSGLSPERHLSVKWRNWASESPVLPRNDPEAYFSESLERSPDLPPIPSIPVADDPI